jgi:CheY-like chemotaxis protein
VDDHRDVLVAVSAMLSDDFDVVGVATDGTQALDMARQVRPDVIVLDVDMPRLDGFQTCRALEQRGSPPVPVVFLSAHGADEIVGEAFRCGGRGYVLKSRAGRDLAGALDQVLLGRLFVPSLTSLLELSNGGIHAMQLHDGMESFLDGLAVFFDVALQRGDATCVISTRQVREGLGDRLRARGWDIGGSSGRERCLVIDAADALDSFMRNGRPDADRLAETAAELDQFRLAVGDGPTPRLTIFGDMSMLLSANGNAEAAVALERLWSTVTNGLPFLTLCGYTTSCFHDPVRNLWADVCAEHAALSHATGV